MSILRNFFEKIHVSLKSGKNNINFTRISMFIFITSSSVLLGMRNVSEKLQKKIKTHFMFNNFFLPKILPFMR